jgi:hypothetical protein
MGLLFTYAGEPIHKKRVGSLAMTADTNRTHLIRPVYASADHRQVEPAPHHLDVLGAHDFYMDPGWLRGTPVDYIMRGPREPIPLGLKGTAELIGGPGRYFRPVLESTRHVSWATPEWLARAEGLRDYFAVWGRLPGSKICKVGDYPKYSSEGRGVIFSSWPLLAREGNVIQWRWALRRITFAVLTKNPALPDILKVRAWGLHGFFHLGDNRQAFMPTAYGLDAHWQTMYDEAKRGFNEHCSEDI